VSHKPDSVHLADTIDLMRSLPAGCAGLVVADPPYNLKIDQEFGVPLSYRDRDGWLKWSKEWIAEATRLLSPTGNLFVYGIHHFAAYIHVHLCDMGLTYRRQIIWHYENGWSRYTNGPACHYEPILWFSRSPKSTFHPIREPYKSEARLKHKIIKNGKVWTPHPEGRLAGDVWRFPTLAGRRFEKEKVDHPTQKPLSLSMRIVEHFSNPGELVVVPFVGSGTECVAAKVLGRHFIGAELNPGYVAIAKCRLSAVTFDEERVHGLFGGIGDHERLAVRPRDKDSSAAEPIDVRVSGLGLKKGNKRGPRATSGKIER